LASRNSFKRLGILFALLFAGLGVVYITMIRMPGKSYSGPLPALTSAQEAIAEELHLDVDKLAGQIGPCCLEFPDRLNQTVEFLERSLQDLGFAVERQSFDVQGQICHNLIAEIKGSAQPEEIVVVGAHYDSCHETPAANDNGSGVAATLALARRFAASRDSGKHNDRTVRFVLFANEEPPYFQTDAMGSLVYARACRAKNENIVAMFSLETIGYYSDEPGSQRYPIAPIGWVYPDRGNFISFVGNYRSRDLVRTAIAKFRESARFPSEGAAMPGWISGVGWSDQWAFWQVGYPGVMVTDTAPYRYPHYHQLTDTPDKLDYPRMARVVEGLEAVVRGISSSNRPQ
jgi:hypothetical protein